MELELHQLKEILDHLKTDALTALDKERLTQFLQSAIEDSDQAQESIERRHAQRDSYHRTDSLEKRIAEQEMLLEASLNLTASLDLQTVLKIVLQAVLNLLKNIDNTHIFLYEDERLTFGAALWANGKENVPWTSPRPNGLTYNVARAGEIIHVPDMRKHPLYVDTGWSGAIIGIPLKNHERVVGVMTAARGEPSKFSNTDLRLLQLLADHAAIAVENARLHTLVNLQAHIDSLTGLPNRRALDERLETECQHASLYNLPLAFLMMDLDNFKDINDTYGHLVGDEVLQAIGQAIAASTRNGDFLARYGGDEMALILPETPLEEVGAIEDRIREAVAACRLPLIPDQTQRISISIGRTMLASNSQDWVELIKAADQALYKAKKRKGKGGGSRSTKKSTEPLS